MPVTSVIKPSSGGAHSALTGLTTGDDHTQYTYWAGRVGGQTINGGTAAGETLTLHSTANATKGKIFFGTASVYDEVNGRLGIGVTSPTSMLQVGTAGSGSASVPGGNMSEQFGAGASSAGTFGLAVGNSASSGSAAGNVALGYGASIGTGASNVVIGRDASLTGAAASSVLIGATTTGVNSNSVLIGTGATGTSNALVAIGINSAAGNSSVSIGPTASSGSSGVAIGPNTSAGNNAIVLGSGATATATGQFVIGGALSITTMYIGKGVTNAAPVAVSINATGGSGTDIAGAELTIAGGRPTGSGAGGDVLIKTAAAGASGTALRTLVERVRVTSGGLVGIGTTPAQTLDVLGQIAANRNTNQFSLNDASKVQLASFEAIVSGGTGGAFRLKPKNITGNFFPAFTLDHLGNMGLGTTLPTGRLHVVSTITTDPIVIFRGAAGQTGNATEWHNSAAAVQMAVAANGRDFVLDTTTGTKFGTATTQKLAFFNATPVVQQTGGVATAGALYTATEQAMLQKVYDTLRTFGFLS